MHKDQKEQVVAELVRLTRKSGEAGPVALDAAREATSVAWLADIVASVSGRARADVYAGSRFDQMGFDSLMYAELAGAQARSAEELWVPISYKSVRIHGPLPARVRSWIKSRPTNQAGARMLLFDVVVCALARNLAVSARSNALSTVNATP